MRFDVDRLLLSLHGVSADVARAAVENLGAELERRLATGARRWIESDLGAVRIGPIEASALDAASLRGLIAERIAVALGAPREEEKSEEEQL
jgi:hypothetical protein